MEKSKRYFNGHAFIVILILVLGLVWRLVYFNDISNSPYGSDLSVDAQYHHEKAIEIINGTFSMENRAFFRAPFYFYFIASVYSIFGINVSAIIYTQFIIGLASCFLIYRITLKLFNRAAATFALLISSFYGMFIYMEHELLYETLAIFLTLLGVYFLILTLQKERITLAMLCGFTFGLSAIVRPSILSFLIFIPLIMLISFRDGISKKSIMLHGSKILKYTTVIALFCLIPIIPVTIANYKAEKDFVLISSQGGMAFYIGNNPDAEPNGNVKGIRNTWKGMMEDYFAIPAKETNNSHLKSSEVSDFWFNKGWQYVLNHPGKTFNLTLKKLYWFWNATEIGNNRIIDFVTGHSKIWQKATFKFWFVCPLALAGIFMSYKEKINIDIPITFIATYMLSTIIFYVGARFRLPVVPFLIMFAGYFVGVIWEIVRTKFSASVNLKWVGVAIVICIATIIFTKPIQLTGANEALGYYYEGMAYEKKNDFQNAVIAFKKAAELNPSSELSYEHLGKISAIQLHDVDQAIVYFKQAILINGNKSSLYNDLGNCYKLKKQYDLAVASYQKSVSLKTNDADTFYNLATVYFIQSNFTQAITWFKKAVALVPNDLESLTQIGLCYANLGDYTNANDILQKAMAINAASPLVQQLKKQLETVK